MASKLLQNRLKLLGEATWLDIKHQVPNLRIQLLMSEGLNIAVMESSSYPEQLSKETEK
jgi:hypothetical protein